MQNAFQGVGLMCGFPIIEISLYILELPNSIAFHSQVPYVHGAYESMISTVLAPPVIYDLFENDFGM